MKLLLLCALASLPALAQPCRATKPADMPTGSAEWIGPCLHGLAEGSGVLRIPSPGGDSNLFYGSMHAGLPVKGIVGSSDPTHSGWRVLPRLDATFHLDPKAPAELQQDPRLYQLAADAARVAAAHYAALQNQPSAAFYTRQAKLLARGPGE